MSESKHPESFPEYPYQETFYHRLNSIPFVNSCTSTIFNTIQLGSSRSKFFKESVEGSVKTFKPLWHHVKPKMTYLIHQCDEWKQKYFDKSTNVNATGSEQKNIPPNLFYQSHMYLIVSCLYCFQVSKHHLIAITDRLQQAIHERTLLYSSDLIKKEKNDLSTPSNIYQEPPELFARLSSHFVRNTLNDVAFILKKMISLIYIFSNILPLAMRLRVRKLIINLPTKWDNLSDSIVNHSIGTLCHPSSLIEPKLKEMIHILNEIIKFFESVEKSLLGYLKRNDFPVSSFGIYNADSIDEPSAWKNVEAEPSSEMIQMESILKPQQEHIHQTCVY